MPEPGHSPFTVKQQIKTMLIAVPNAAIGMSWCQKKEKMMSQEERPSNIARAVSRMCMGMPSYRPILTRMLEQVPKRGAGACHSAM